MLYIINGCTYTDMYMHYLQCKNVGVQVHVCSIFSYKNVHITYWILSCAMQGIRAAVLRTLTAIIHLERDPRYTHMCLKCICVRVLSSVCLETVFSLVCLLSQTWFYHRGHWRLNLSWFSALPCERLRDYLHSNWYALLSSFWLLSPPSSFPLLSPLSSLPSPLSPLLSPLSSPHFLTPLSSLPSPHSPLLTPLSSPPSPHSPLLTPLSSPLFPLLSPLSSLPSPPSPLPPLLTPLSSLPSPHPPSPHSSSPISMLWHPVLRSLSVL